MRREAKNWYDGALVDLEEARDALSRGRYNWAIFAAHQSVEKALKAAYIVLKRRIPPKTHDLTVLSSELNLGELGVEEDLIRGVSELSPYYTIARYPNAGLERPWESIDRSTAEKFVGVAERIVEIIGEKTKLGGHRSS